MKAFVRKLSRVPAGACTVVCSIVFASGVVVPTDARGASPLTITGPATVVRGSVVTLTGTAPAGSTVTVHLLRQGAKALRLHGSSYPLAPITADDHGNYSVQYFGGVTARYYASVGSAKSPVGTTAARGVYLVPASLGWANYAHAQALGYAEPGSVVRLQLTAATGGPRSGGSARVNKDGTWSIGFTRRTSVSVRAVSGQFHSNAVTSGVRNGWAPESYMLADGRPGGWDPCTRSIPVYVNTAGTSARFAALVKRAVAEVAAVTALPVRYAGTTRAAYVAHAMVFLAKSQSARELNPRKGAHLTEIAVTDNLGASNVRTLGDGTTIERPLPMDAAQAIFNRQRLPSLLKDSYRKGWLPEAYSYILHDLGHMMGLAHVGSQQQVMRSSGIAAIPHLRGGDRTGLRLAGAGGCYRDQAPNPVGGTF